MKSTHSKTLLFKKCDAINLSIYPSDPWNANTKRLNRGRGMNDVTALVLKHSTPHIFDETKTCHLTILCRTEIKLSLFFNAGNPSKINLFMRKGSARKTVLLKG